MAFIDNGAGNSMAYGADREGAYNAFMPSLGGCEAYIEREYCPVCGAEMEDGKCEECSGSDVGSAPLE